MRYAVLHGRRSGHGRDRHLLEHGVNVLRAGGHDVEVLPAADVAQAHEACQRAVGDGADVLLVIGGDGVVRIAARHCANSGTALAIIPTGSGNDTVRSLGIPTGTAQALAVARRGHRRTIDLISAAATSGGQEWHDYVVGSVPAALDARIAARSQRVPSFLGPMRYSVATLAEIPQLRPQPYRLTLDDRSVEVDALVVAVCNLPIFGGGMQIAPQADPADGWLDVVIIEKVSPWAAVGLLRAVFAGSHAGHAAVRIERCRKVTVEGPELTAYGDGDPLGPLPLTCSVVPRSLGVVVPS
ncbi:MAG: diacylglycerol kinase family protein [Ornithinimicrobium sp.]